MRTLSIPLAIAGILATTVLASAEESEVRQEAETPHYHLVLLIGPNETVYTAAQARLERPSAGEIMLGGRVSGGIADIMPEAGGPARGATVRSSPDLHHLELHVYSRATGRAVPEAHVTIAVTDGQRKRRSMPIARMYGVDEGPEDLHYGNNVILPPGAYTIETAINGEHARFAVKVPEGS